MNSLASSWRFLVRESGIRTVKSASKDVHILLVSRLFRMFAFGASTLVLALYFAALGHSDAQIGFFMSATLWGDTLISLLLSFVADNLGRRRTMMLGCILMSISGIVFATTSNYFILLAAAILGVISPSGREVGPFRAVEESSLAHLSDPKTRTDIFAWYVVVGTLGAAGGTLIGGWIVTASQSVLGLSAIASFRVIFYIYTLLGIIKAGLTWLLSTACEPSRAPQNEGEESEAFLGGSANATQTKPTPEKKGNAFTRISRKSWSVVLRLCALFSMDSFGSGMVPYSLIAYFMDRKFSLPEGKLGTVLSMAWFFSSIGNIFASAISKRIGLIKCMVFTHLPSSLALALIPAPSSLLLTIFLILFRSSLATMDQAPRSVFIANIVLPEERTAVMGFVNTLRTLSQSGGPLATGILAGEDHFWVAFLIAGALKTAYDLGLLWFFVNHKAAHGQQAQAQDKDQEPPDAAFALSDDDEMDDDLDDDDVAEDIALHEQIKKDNPRLGGTT